MVESFDSVRRRVALDRMNRRAQQPPDAAVHPDQQQTPEAAQLGAEQFVTLMPGELPGAIPGKDYIIDENTDLANTPGAIEHGGIKIRPVTPEEYEKLNRIQGDPALNRQFGPRRLQHYIAERQATAAAAAGADGGGAIPGGESPQGRPEAVPTYTLEQLQDMKTRLGVYLNGYENATLDQLTDIGERIRQAQTYDDIKGLIGNIRAIGGRHMTMPPPGLFIATGGGWAGNIPPAGPGGPGNATPQGPAAGPRAQPLAQPTPPLRGFVPNFVRRNRSREMIPGAIMQHEPPTMDKILADKKMQKDMYILLANSKFNRPDLVEKFTRSIEDPDAMEQGDWDALTVVRADLERRSLLSAELAGGISKEDMLAMLQEEPQLAFLRNSLSPDRAGEVIRQNMSSVFMQMSDDEIDQAVFAHRANQDIRASKQYQRLAERTRQVLGSPEVTPDNVVQVNDPRLFNRIIRPGFFSLGESRKRSLTTLDAINTNIGFIKGLLGATISSNAELRTQAVREAHGLERVPLPGTTGPSSFREAQRSADTAMGLESIQNRVPQFKQTYAEQFGIRWDDDTPEQREENFFNTVEAEESQRQAHPSWFGWALLALISMLTGRMRNDPQVKPLFAAA